MGIIGDNGFDVGFIVNLEFQCNKNSKEGRDFEFFLIFSPVLWRLYPLYQDLQFKNIWECFMCQANDQNGNCSLQVSNCHFSSLRDFWDIFFDHGLQVL